MLVVIIVIHLGRWSLTITIFDFCSYEKTFDPVPTRDAMLARPWIAIASFVVYGLFITYGQKYFASRPAWNWRKALALWNFGLSIFSLIGFFRTLPALTHNYLHYSVRENFCMDPESSIGSGSTGLWTLAFVLSKFP